MNRTLKSFNLFQRNRSKEILFTLLIIASLLFIRSIPVVLGDGENNNYYSKEASEILQEYYESQSLPIMTQDENGEQLNPEELSGEQKQALYTKGEVDKLKNKLTTVTRIIETFKPIYNVLSAFGILFAVLNSILVLFRSMARDVENPSESTFTQFYLTLLITIVVLTNMNVILTAINNLGDLIVKASRDYIVMLVTDVQIGLFSGEYANQITTSKELLDFDNQMVVINIITSLLNCVIDGIIYSIGIRMVIRRVFMPIAIADMSIDGTRSAGYRYLMRYLGYYIQLGIVYISMIGFIFVYAIAINSNDALIGIWASIAARGALAGILAGSGQLSYEILNAD